MSNAGSVSGLDAQARWNRRSAPYPSESSIPAEVSARAVERPAAIALVDGDRHTSYASLVGQSAALAKRLTEAGVATDEIVAICLPRSDELIIAELATLIAGGAYLVVGPDDTQSQRRRLVAIARSRVVITNAELASLYEGMAVTVIVTATGEAHEAATARTRGSVTSRQLAYVAITSGSTGEPKAVTIEHRSVLRLLFAVDYVDLGPDRVLLHSSPPEFDASTFEIWGALVHGGTCVVHRERPTNLASLARTIAAHKVDTVWLTSSLFNLVVDLNPSMLAPVQQLLIGGETLSPHHVERAVAALPNTRIVNGYGPTECTTFACCHPIVPPVEPSVRIPIGVPIANTTAYVVRVDGSLADVDEVGQLFLGGHGVARGYLGDPTSTMQAFCSDPFSAEPDGRLYATGDLARWRPDGLLDLVGRLDAQVKVRGHRVELGGVERALRQIPEIRDAAVVAGADDSYGRRLVAYVVRRDGLALTPAQIRDRLSAELPAAHIPSQFFEIAQLPLDTNGKLARRMLTSASDARPMLSSELSMPTTPTELLVAEVFGTVLGVDGVGADDDFFELGGDSLLVAEASVRLARCGLDIDPQAMFKNRTPRTLAASIDRGGATSAIPVPTGVGALAGPLTRPQEAIARAIVRSANATIAYTIHVEVEMACHVTAEVLASAFQIVQRRHESLRTIFDLRGRGRADVLSADVIPIPVAIVDLSDESASTVLQRIDDSRKSDLATPIDIEVGPPLRATLLTVPGDRQLLHVAAHHISFDGWSVGVMLSELAVALAELTGRDGPVVGPLRFQYRDFQRWQQEWPSPIVRADELRHWTTHLVSASPIWFPASDPPGRGGSADGGLVETTLAIAARVREVGAHSGATLFMTMAAVFAVVLHGDAGTDDVVFSTPVSGRTRPEFDDLIGCFYDSVLLRVALQDDLTFAELLQRVRDETLSALAHQHTEIGAVLDKVGTTFDRVKFAVQDRSSLRLDRRIAPWFDTRSVRIDSAESTRRDLHFHAWDIGDELRLQVRYSPTSFDKSSARRFVDRYATILQSVVDAPWSTVGSLVGGATKSTLSRRFGSQQRDDGE